MARIHDLGGMHGFGPVDPQDAESFHHEWEARVWVLNRLLQRQGLYTLDEFRYAVERLEPGTYLAASYYERWLYAIETLLREKGVVDAV